MSYIHLKLELGLFLTGYIVALLAYSDEKLTIACLP